MNMNSLMAQAAVLVLAPLAVCRASVPLRPQPADCPANFLRKLACHSMCGTIGMAKLHGECVTQCCGGHVTATSPPHPPAVRTTPATDEDEWKWDWDNIFANDTEAPKCCASVYEHAYFIGAHERFCGSVDLVSTGWRSRFGSLIAARGCKATLFDRAHFRGRKYGPFVHTVFRLEYEGFLISSMLVESTYP